MVGPSSLDLSGVGVRPAGERRAPLPGELDLSGIGAASTGSGLQVGPDGIAPATPWAEEDALRQRMTVFEDDAALMGDAPRETPAPITQDAVDMAGSASLDMGWSRQARGMAAGAVLADGLELTGAEQPSPQDDDADLRRAAWLIDGYGKVRPEDAARAREVSRATGFPLSDALANLDSGERIVARAGLDKTLQDLRDTAPRTLGLLADAEAVLHAKDDVPALSKFEQALAGMAAYPMLRQRAWDELAKGVVRAPMVTGRSLLQMFGQAGGAVASVSGMLPDNQNTQGLARLGEAMEAMGLAASRRTQENIDNAWFASPVSSRYTAEQLWNRPSLMLDPNWLVPQTTDAAAQLIPTVLAYMFGGGPAATVVGGWQEGANFYEQLRESGMDRDRAQAASLVFGAIVGKLEAFGVERMFAQSTAETLVGRVLHRLSVGASESGTEWLENPIQGAIEGVARGESMPEVMARIEAGMKDISVLPSSFILGMFAPGATGSLQGERRRAREQVAGQSGGGDDGGQAATAPARLDASTRGVLEDVGAALTAIARDAEDATARVQAGQQLAVAAQAAEESRLRQRSPAAFAEIAARLVPQGNEQMWLDAATVETFMQAMPADVQDGAQTRAGTEQSDAAFGPGVLDELGIAPDALERSRTTGAPVAVDTARVLAARQDVRAAVLDAARLTPDGMTGAEARAFDPQVRLAEGVEKVRTAQQRAADTLREERRWNKELVASGYPKHVVRDVVALNVASAKAFSARYGWDQMATLGRVSFERGTAEQAQAGGTFAQAVETAGATEAEVEKSAQAQQDILNGVTWEALEYVSRSGKTRRTEQVARTENVPAEIRAEVEPRAKDGLVPRALVEAAARTYQRKEDEKALRQAANAGVGADVHRTQNLQFTAMPVSGLENVVKVKLHHSRSYGGKQGSRYYLAMIDGRVAYVRVSNHWGHFFTNIYDGDASAPQGAEADQYGRVGYRPHNWELLGGKRGSDGRYQKVSQAGYVFLDANDPRIFMQSAFHGSPYRFDEFTLNAIGSGEGAQAFGWGLYFAGKKEVAEWYRQRLSEDSRVVINGETYAFGESVWKRDDGTFVDPNSPIGVVVNMFWSSGNEEFGVPQSKEETISNLETSIEAIDDGTEDYQGQAQTYRAALEIAQKATMTVFKGQLYEVDIPEDGVLLRWDSPLDEQPGKVRSALRVMPDKEIVQRRDGEFRNKKGWELYEQLSNMLGSDEAASKQLRSLGIKGIKYLDGTSRGAGEGTYNYVIFDDAAVEILNTFYQSASGTPRAHVQFLDNGQAIVRAFDGADLSSVLHETCGHIWFDNLERVIAGGMAPALTRFADRAQQIAQTAEVIASGGMPQAVVDIATRAGEAARGDNPRPALTALREELRALAGKERESATGTDDGGAAAPANPALTAMRSMDSALSALISHARGIEQAASDMVTLREWAQVPTEGPLTPEQQITLHETTARGMEAWLREGQSPTPELAGVFQRIAAWLRKIYASVAELNVQLTDEVRDVFGRMIATDQDISRNREVSTALEGEDDFLRDLSQAVGGLELDDAERLADLRSKAEAAVQARMDRATLKDRAKRMREHKAEAARIVGERPLWQLVDYLASPTGPGLNRNYLADLYGEDAVKSLTRRRPGLVRNEGGSMLDDVAQEFGWPDGDTAWREMYDTMALRGETKTGQIREMAMQMMAVEDAEHTPDEMLGAGEEYGDYLEQVDATLTRLMVRERWARRAEKPDAAAVMRQAEALRTPRARILSIAAGEIASTPLRDVRPDRYGAALRVALRERDTAIKRGDVLEAFRANERARIAAELLDMAHVTRRQAEEVQARARKLLAAKPEVRDGLHTEGIRRIAVNLGLVEPRAPLSRGDALVPMRDIVASGVDAEEAVDATPSFPDWLLDGRGPDERRQPDDRGRLNWRQLTPAELRDVANLLDYLDHAGRNLRGADKRSEKARIDAAAVNGAMPMLALKPERMRPRDGTKRRQFTDAMARFWAQSNALQWQMRQADGFSDIGPKGAAGPNESGLLRQIRDNEEAARARMEKDVAPRIAAAMDVLGQSVKRWEKQHGRNLQITGRDGKVVAVPRLLADNNSPHWTADAVIALALNMGNAGNMARLRGGYPDLTHETVAQLLGDQMADRLFSVDPKTGQMMQGPVAYTYHPQTGEVLDASPVSRRPGPAAKGLLSVADWQAVQQVWDTIESLWADTAGVHKRMFGFEPPKIEPLFYRLDRESGAPDYMRGGYYPVRYDPRLSEKVGAWAEADDILNRNESIHGIPAAKRGHTKARADGATGLPLRLDTGVLLEHLTDAVTFIHLAETVRFADRVTQHPEWRRAYISAFGKEDHAAIRNNLRGLVRRDAPADSAIVRFADVLRPYIVSYGLAWNFKAALLQTTALAPAMNDIGRQPVLRGLSRVASRDGISIIRAVQQTSPYMASRMHNFDQDMRRQMKELSPDRRGLRVQVGGRTITHDDVVEAGMLPIACADAVATTAVWLGAYEKRLGELGTDKAAAHAAMQRGGDTALAAHEEAVRYADDTVKKSNPDGDNSSRSSFLRSKNAERMLNQFSSATQLISQRQQYYGKALGKGIIGWREYVRFQAYDMGLQAVGLWLLLSVVRGVFGGDDEDRKLLMKSFFASLLDIGAARLPVFGSPVAEMITGEGGARGGARVSTALDMPMQIGGKAAKAARNVVKKPTEKEVLQQAGWAVLALVSFVSRIPIDRVTRNAIRGWDQMAEGKGTPLSILMPRPGK